MAVLFTIFFFLASIFPVNGLDLNISRISDDSLLRNRLKDTWFLDSPRNVLSRRAIVETLESGERVEVSVIEGRDEFMVILSRELIRGRLATDANPGYSRRPTGLFPGWAQGSWMLTRNKATGEPTLIRIFLRSDEYTYIQFRPFGPDKSQMDVVLYGGYITRSMPVAVPLERLYTMPLNEVLRLAEGKIDFHYFEPDPVMYRDTWSFVNHVRQRLGSLSFADDGAIDENGSYVYIDSLQPQTERPGLNCSGFVKWLIDGILRPVTGQRLSITPLKAPFGNRGSSFTANWEESRDVYFGLDWIRNLAAQTNGTLRSSGYRALEEFEIRHDIFSYIIMNENNRFVDRSYPGFLNEAGYGIEGLRPMLYTLAIDEPYSFYLAAVNTEIRAPITRTNLRGSPILRQYFHVAALVPYFDEFGIFRIAVFESAAETSFNTFRARYPAHYINLVKIPVRSAFDP